MIELYNEAKQLLNSEKYSEALNLYLALVEKGFDGLDFETKIEAYIDLADCYYFLKDYSIAGNYYAMSLIDSDYNNSSYVNYRIGECLFYSGVEDKAKVYLLKAYEIDGDLMFGSNTILLKLIEENI